MTVLAGHKAIVTGGSQGIGLAIARKYASEGAKIVLVGRSARTLESALASLPGQDHAYSVMDLNVGAANNSEWSSLLRKHCETSILVNCAGITHYSLLTRTPHDVMDAVLNTNLRATIFATKHVAAAMMKHRRSDVTVDMSILFVASALAHRGGAGSAVYAASKAGLIGFSKALAQELAPRSIRCNILAPGYVETAMTGGMREDLREKVLAGTAAGRMGTVDEIAGAALLLASNRFMNGTCLTIDGGASLE
ncbi:hypothetical protein PYCC9005_001929 [Savitreella phatthalungensis]